MVSCCPIRSCRLGFSICSLDPSLQFKILSQVHLTDLRIGKNLVRRTRREYSSLADDIRPSADTQGFTDVMVRNQYADALVGQVLDYSLNIGDRKWIDAREGLIQQNKAGIGG